MKVTLGKDGVSKTWQDEFPETTTCRCGREARIAFVAHEGIDPDDKGPSICKLHRNEGKGGFWPHDYCAVAVYFCSHCCEATAFWNQG